MTIEQSFFLSCIDVIQYYLILNKMCDKTLKLKAQDVSMIFIASMAVVVSSQLLEGGVAYAVNFTILLSFNWLLHKQKPYQLVFSHLMSMILLLLIQLITLVPLKLLYKDIEMIFESIIVLQTISLLLVVVMIRYIPIKVFMHYVDNGNPTFRVVSINMFAIVTVLVLYWNADIQGMWGNMLSIFILTGTLIVINLVMMNSGLKNKHAEEQVKMYEYYYPIINELTDELRARQHDFDSHLAALRVMIELKEPSKETFSQMDAYLSEVEDSFSNSHLIRLDNKVVAGFLYSKKKWAQQRGIDFDIELNNLELKTVLKDYELIEILSVLINNAFETKVQENAIKILTDKEKGMNVIEVANKHPYLKQEQINKMLYKGYSTKQAQGRGIGLYKIRKLIDRHRGILTISNKDREGNYLVFRMLLP